MKEPELIYYLPRGVDPNAADHQFRAAEIKDRRTKDVRHLQIGTRYVYSDEQRLTEVIREAPPNSYLVCWSVHILTTAIPALKEVLSKKKHQGINLHIFEKRLTIDPDSEFVQDLLGVLSSVWTRKDEVQQEAALTQLSAEERAEIEAQNVRLVYLAVPRPPLGHEIQQKIKDLCLLGKSIRGIAKELNLSTNTVQKYRREIKDLIPEPKTEKRTSFSVRIARELSRIPLIEKDTAIYNAVFNLIASVPAVATQKTYARIMRMLFVELEASGKESIRHPSEIQIKDVAILRENLRGRYAESSERTIMQVIARFFTMCRKDGSVTNQFKSFFDPWQKRSIKVQTSPLMPESIKALLQAAERELEKSRGTREEMLHHRNFIALLILTMTGMRGFSLLSLERKDFSMRGDNYYLTMIVKRIGRTTIPIPKELGREIKEYIDRFLLEHPEKTRLIFSKQRGLLESIEHSRLKKVIDDFSAKAGVSEKVHIHSFRSTFATELYKAGKSLEEIRMLMAHTNIKQTLAYVRLYDLQPETNWIPYARERSAS